MRRFASIDFLRGLAIWMMIVLHVIMFVIDRNMLNEIDTLPLMTFIAFILIIFMGGLAGFFLLVSATGNMISMQRNYQAEKSVNDVAVKQVVGGAILLVFAVLTEGTLGYNGALGEIVRGHLDDWTMILWRGYNFETIHTIAWCVIINGIVQWALSRNGGWKKVGRNIKVYVFLAILVVVATPLLWSLVGTIIPGYPYETYLQAGIVPPSNPLGYIGVQYPMPGVTSFWGYIYLFFLAPLAGTDEPMFPYLAISFVGSIIGILMSMDREKVPRNFPGKIMRVAFVMFIVGLIGLLANVIMMLDDPIKYPNGIATLVMLYDHRYWTTPNTPPSAWLFQFLVLNGASIIMSLLVIRLVEFRGKGEPFGRKTQLIRRWGFAAFTIYNYQMLYFLPWFLVTLLFTPLGWTNGLPYGYEIGHDALGNLGWGGAFLVLGLSILLIDGVLRLWEKRDYVFGFEWCIGAIASRVLPVKKQVTANSEEKRRWWQAGRLDVKNALISPEWLNIVEPSEIPHERKQESRLALKLAIIGLLVFPLSIVAYRIARAAETTESGPYCKRAKILAFIGLCFAAVWITFAFIFTLADLGIAF